MLLEGSGAISGTGNGGDNWIAGNSSNNVLDGAGGADFLFGHGGNDTFHVDNLFDVVIENADEGIDTIISTVNRILSANVENLILQPGAGGLAGAGSNLNNTLTGNEGDNVIDGAAGTEPDDRWYWQRRPFCRQRQRHSDRGPWRRHERCHLYDGKLYPTVQCREHAVA